VVVATVKEVDAVPFAAGVSDEAVSPQVTVGFTGVMAQVNPTAKLNPPNDVTVIVEVVVFPAAVVAEAGEADKLKSFNVKA
jgi:hypothetical protein